MTIMIKNYHNGCVDGVARDAGDAFNPDLLVVLLQG